MGPRLPRCDPEVLHREFNDRLVTGVFVLTFPYSSFSLHSLLHSPVFWVYSLRLYYRAVPGAGGPHVLYLLNHVCLSYHAVGVSCGGCAVAGGDRRALRSRKTPSAASYEDRRTYVVPRGRGIPLRVGQLSSVSETGEGRNGGSGAWCVCRTSARRHLVRLDTVSRKCPGSTGVGAGRGPQESGHPRRRGEFRGRVGGRGFSGDVEGVPRGDMNDDTKGRDTCLVGARKVPSPPGVPVALEVLQGLPTARGDPVTPLFTTGPPTLSSR